MAIDFSALKTNRKSLTDKLMSEVQKLNAPAQGGNSQDEDKYWKPEVDKAGNGYAIIRFLPAPAGEDLPYVRIGPRRLPLCQRRFGQRRNRRRIVHVARHGH